MGVGKNMVKSIRHWGLAFKILELDTTQGSRRPKIRPSALGEAWFDESLGVDPYMELPGTDWLMHWLLLAPSSQAPVWWLTFNEFSAIEFTEEHLTQFVTDRLADFGKPNPNSVKKDISALLRMYSSGHGSRATFEDRVDAPFRDLGLLQPSVHEPGHYRFNVGHKPALPAAVFTATVLDFASRTDPSTRVVSLSRALAEPGAPGRAFKLTDSEALELVRMVAQSSKLVRLTSSAGMPQITIKRDAGEIASDLLAEHYATFGVRLRWRMRPDGDAA
jgi:hypothetical protein